MKKKIVLGIMMLAGMFGALSNIKAATYTPTPDNSLTTQLNKYLTTLKFTKKQISYINFLVNLQANINIGYYDSNPDPEQPSYTPTPQVSPATPNPIVTLQDYIQQLPTIIDTFNLSTSQISQIMSLANQCVEQVVQNLINQMPPPTQS